MTTEIDFHIAGSQTRAALRKQVVEKFLTESPGTGSGADASKYIYYVETLSNGKKVYLTRPAYLKKGFDFRISIEGMTFLTGQDYPKHDDIFNDLEAKRDENPDMAKRLYDAIRRVYDCDDPDDIMTDFKGVSFKVGYSVEFLLKVIKWLLIEQDVRDWNYSGRAMFMGGVKDVLNPNV